MPTVAASAGVTRRATIDIFKVGRLKPSKPAISRTPVRRLSGAPGIWRSIGLGD